MKKSNSLTNFVETQETLNNIRTSLKKLYHDDEKIKDSEYLERLTDQTYKIMVYMDEVYDDLLRECGVNDVASEFGTSPSEIASDIIEILLLSTIAKQNMLIENIKNREE